jgi:hypothetical protein
VFRRAGGAWKQEARLVAPDGSDGDWFGWAVAVLGDRVLVGAHQDDVAGEASGSAHVFRYRAGGWVHERRLTSSDLAAHDAFGFHLDLNADTAVVGAWRDDHAGHESGSAYVFDLD